MTTNYKGYRIDYKDSAAVIYKHGQFIKGHASGETPNSLSGLQKAKNHIDSLITQNIK